MSKKVSFYTFGCRLNQSETAVIQNGLEANGYDVVNFDKEADIVVTATGNCDIVNGEHFQAMKDKTIVCNIGHFDNEIDVAWLRSNGKWDEVKPQVDLITLKNGRRTHRACCRFIDLPPSVETAIQRYIIRVERERRARYV